MSELILEELFLEIKELISEEKNTPLIFFLPYVNPDFLLVQSPLLLVFSRPDSYIHA
jgi:hypothetical protein